MNVPSHYILSRDFKEPEKLERIFAITPILGCVVTDAKDTELGMKVHHFVILTDDANGMAERLLTKFGMPPVIIGEANGLEAVYADGRRERVDA